VPRRSPPARLTWCHSATPSSPRSRRVDRASRNPAGRGHPSASAPPLAFGRRRVAGQSGRPSSRRLQLIRRCRDPFGCGAMGCGRFGEVVRTAAWLVTVTAAVQTVSDLGQMAAVMWIRGLVLPRVWTSRVRLLNGAGPAFLIPRERGPASPRRRERRRSWQTRERPPVPVVTAIPVRRYQPAPGLLSEQAMEVVTPHLHPRTRLASGPTRRVPAPTRATKSARRWPPMASSRYLALVAEVGGAALALYLLGSLENLLGR
jgi:hypothetical protein